MNLLTFLLICCFTYCRSLIPPSQEAEFGAAPYFVYFRSSFQFCGAVLIDVDIVLSAGHCVVDVFESIRVELGVDTLEDDHSEYLQQRGARKTLVHPEYKLDENRIQAFNDLGLVWLDEPVNITKYVRPIRIGEVDHNLGFGTWYGFGSTNSTSPKYSRVLRTKDAKLINHEDCELMLQNTTYKVTHQCSDICTEEGTCLGDSGGPFIQRKKIGENIFEDQLVGIISWGADDRINCDKAPAVSMNVAHYRDWIYDGIKQMRGDA